MPINLGLPVIRQSRSSSFKSILFPDGRTWVVWWCCGIVKSHFGDSQPRALVALREWINGQASHTAICSRSAFTKSATATKMATMPMICALIEPNVDFIFGLPGNTRLQALAEPAKQRACQLWADVQSQDVVPDAVRLFDEFSYAAGSWSRAWRVLLKAEVMALGGDPRFVVTSLDGLDAGCLYEDLYCARGQAENFIKYLKDDLASDRT